MYDGFTLFEEFFRESQAVYVKSYLEDKGIRLVLNISRMPYGGIRMTISMHRLYVFNEDLEKAEKIYEEFKRQESVEYEHEYTDEEFEELAVNSKFEDYNPDSFENTGEFAQPEESDENYQDADMQGEPILHDEPYYRKDVGLSISKNLVRSKIDEELDENKVYKCPNCKDKFLEVQKMEGAVKFLYTTNYIFILLIILAYIGTSGHTEESFAKNFVKILPLNIGIAVYHIISVSTSKYRCDVCGHVEKH